MTKIMLVEDDKSLREIYGVRLLAEGYDIVSAGDGEEALAMAIKERPTLIVSDVMMPKISGFDMLDILRSTTETRDIKVIMMTALSTDDQRKRGEQLGANRYLVKSQVGIEDVVRTVHEVLGDSPVAAAQAASAPAPASSSPIPTATIISDPGVASPAVTPATAPAVSPLPQPTAPFSSPRNGSTAGDKIIQPLDNNPRASDLDIQTKMAEELASDQSGAIPPPPPPPAPLPSNVTATSTDPSYVSPYSDNQASAPAAQTPTEPQQPVVPEAPVTPPPPPPVQPDPGVYVPPRQ